MAHIAQDNPFGDGSGGDGKMEKGGNDFTEDPRGGSKAPAEAGNDFTKNPAGFNGGSVKPSPQGPDKGSIPQGGREPFSKKPSGEGQKPSKHFKLKG